MADTLQRIDGSSAVPDPEIAVLPLDLADLESIETLANTVISTEPRLDILVLKVSGSRILRLRVQAYTHPPHTPRAVRCARHPRNP